LSADRLAERCAIRAGLTVLDAIFHVTEHFSCLGQIILVVKMFPVASAL
jgi:hypothetical protein